MTDRPTDGPTDGPGAVSDELVAAVAADLRSAESTRTPLAPVRDRLPAGDIDVAYRVQELNTDHAVSSGRRLVGRKIGLTSPAVQQQLGVAQPDFGALFADRCFTDGDEVDAELVLQPRVEAEVALVLGADLPHADVTVAELAAAVAQVMPAIEIVGSRIAGWDIDIVDTVADNASSGAIVLGWPSAPPDPAVLGAAGMALEVDGRIRSTGSGAACLGHPYRAALWLARTMAGRGAPLRAGDVVMTGALGAMVPIDGRSVRATIQGLGSVSATFSPGGQT